MKVLGQCVFQIFNNDFSHEERHRMIKGTLEAYKESKLDAFPYDELADFFIHEIESCKSIGTQEYKIDRMLVEFSVSFSAFILAEFREDIEHPAWDEICKRVQMFFIVFSEALVAAGRADKVGQVPNVSYMKTMQEELKICGSSSKQAPTKHFSSKMSTKDLTTIFNKLAKSSFLSGSLSDWLFALTGDGVLNSKISWTAQNSRTKMPSKISLLDFLVVMGFTEHDIRENINDCFSVANGNSFSSKDYSKKKDWKRDMISEYHNFFVDIVK